MNPWGAVRGQSLGLGSSLLALALTGTLTALLTIAVTGGAVLFAFAALYITYVAHRRREAAQRPPSAERIQGDHLIALEALAVSLGPFLAFWIVVGSDGAPMPDAPEIETFLIGASVLLAVIFCSSLIDWLYVTPRRDGLVCLPPCRGEGHSRWLNLTKVWILHRLIAEVSWILVPAITLVIIVVELSERISGNWDATIKFVGIFATIVSAIAKFSSPHVIAGGRVLRTTPEFALGDTISWSARTVKRSCTRFLKFERNERGSEMRIGPVKLQGRERSASGSHLYVMDVALDKIRVLELGLDGRVVNEPPRPATRDLVRQNAITECRTDQPCQIAGRCLQINERCERGQARYRDR